MHWLPLALYVFWGPLVLWCLLLALAILKGKPAKLQINAGSIVGAVVGLAAVTIGWEFEGWWGRDISGGLWLIMISSWLTLLSPLASLGGIFGLINDLNVAHRYDYSIVGDGYGVAGIAVAITFLSMVFPILIGRGYDGSDRSRARRFLTVRARGFKLRSWSSG